MHQRPNHTRSASKIKYPLVNLQKAIENGPVEIVDLPINSMVIFHCYVSSPEGNGLVHNVRPWNPETSAIDFPMAGHTEFKPTKLSDQQRSGLSAQLSAWSSETP